MKICNKIQPRRWQKNALDAWLNNYSGIAHVVTGGGKTVFSYMCISKFFERFSKGRVVIVVPTLALLDQWAVDVCDSFELNPSVVKCFSGLESHDEPGVINIIVMNTARNLIGWLCGDKDVFLIVDECHRAGTPRNSVFLEGDYAATLGLSATPYRELDDGFDKYIRPALGEVVYEYDYKDAHSDGVIVDFELRNIEISMSHDQSQDIKERFIDDAVRDRESVKSKIKTQKLVIHALRVAWSIKIAKRYSAERIIIFHERVESLRTIENMLQKHGITSVTYHSKLSASLRRDNLRLFRRGETNILITCRALDEGANIPESNIAIIAQSTKSTRQRVQRLGRVLRPAKNKKFATIFTFYAGEEERERLMDEEDGLEGVASINWKQGRIL